MKLSIQQQCLLVSLKSQIKLQRAMMHQLTPFKENLAQAQWEYFLCEIRLAELETQHRQLEDFAKKTQ